MRSLMKTPMRGEWIYLLVLVVLFGALGYGRPFEPYDWVQHAVAAHINEKEYAGDGILVAIDEETIASIEGRRWSRDHLANLLNEIGSGQPRQVVIYDGLFIEETKNGEKKLAKALVSLPRRAIWRIDAVTPEDVDLTVSRQGRITKPEGFSSDSSRIDTAAAGRVIPAVMNWSGHNDVWPLHFLVTTTTTEGTFPSIAYLLAKDRRPASSVTPSSIPILSESGGVHKPAPNTTFVDIAYDLDSIPTISAANVLNREYDRSLLTDKLVVIGFTSSLAHYQLRTHHGNTLSYPAATLLAAQTLIDGPPIRIGWIPAFLVAVLGTVGWLFLRRPYGRIVAVLAFSAVLISPIFLERALVYQETSLGVFLFLFLAVGKVWIRGREAVRTHRSAAEIKARFLAQASHDLRQPIHAIGLLSERLLQSDLTDIQRELVSKISWSVDSASRMFRSLLDIAAIESGTLQTNIGPVSINDLLAEIDLQNELVAEQAGVTLRFVPSELIVKTDRALIGTMLQNLVSNAIKHSPGKAVLIGCRRKGGRISLHVIDNGRGIPTSDIEHVRKEFYRSSHRNGWHSDNKGLGLTIVSRMAALLGLKFTLRSSEGHGTAASIEGLECTAMVPEEQRAHPRHLLPLTGLQVAIADDNDETLHTTQELLEQWGCNVRSFSQAPKLEQLQDCDVLLSDFDFGSGNTLIDHSGALADIARAGIHLIIISGHNPDQIRQEMQTFNGPILSKPLRAAELRSVLMATRIS